MTAFIGSKGEEYTNIFDIILGFIVFATFMTIGIKTRKTMAPLLKQMCALFSLAGLFLAIGSIYWNEEYLLALISG